VHPDNGPEELLDRRLLRAAWLVGLVALPFAALAGALSDGSDGALGASYGAAAVSLNGVAAAWISRRGAKTERGIGIAQVVVALPIRMALLAAAVLLAVGPLALPDRPVGFAVIAAELALLVVQSLLVLRSPTFVGPLEKGVTE
jgi:hypothetical protein